jgi:hypothetical protein
VNLTILGQLQLLQRGQLALEPDLPLGLNVDIKMDLKWAMDIKLNLSLVLEWI